MLMSFVVDDAHSIMFVGGSKLTNYHFGSYCSRVFQRKCSSIKKEMIRINWRSTYHSSFKPSITICTMHILYRLNYLARIIWFQMPSSIRHSLFSQSILTNSVMRAPNGITNICGENVSSILLAWQMRALNIKQKQRFEKGCNRMVNIHLAYALIS